MPPIDQPFGTDTLLVPCYLATGDDDPGLAAWKREHPDLFVAGTWTRPARRPGQPSPERRDRTLAWMTETRDLERAQSAPGGRLDPNWAQAALRSAMLPIPPDAAGDEHADPPRGRPDTASTAQGDFELYPRERRQPALVERISDPVDPITARIRDVDSQLHVLIDTTFRDRAAAVDRSGSAANFGTRLHTLLGELVRAAAIPGVEVEQSFIGGQDVLYGTAGSIRTDILLRIDDKVVAVWDFKTGQAPRLPEPRKQQIRSAIQSDYSNQNIPVEILYEGFYRK